MLDVIDRKHPSFEKRVAQWERQRDCIEGEDAVKAKTTVYLPSLSGQAVPPAAITPQSTSEPNGYVAYLRRASFLNATARTVEAMVGLMFARAPKVEWPKASKDALEVVGHGGESLLELMETSADEVVGVGRQGLLVDIPATQPGDPYVAAYMAEVIRDWEDAVVGGRRKTIRVHLYECDVGHDANGAEVLTERVRVLRLLRTREEAEALALEIERPIDMLSASDFTEGPVYVQVVYQREGKDSKSRVVAAIRPQALGGAVFREIPFVFVGPKNTLSKVDKPMLLDLTVVNLSHYRNSADLEHGAFFTSIPQPYVAGAGKLDPNQFPVGSGRLWHFVDANAKADYLEYTGAGLGFLKDLMSEKRSQMATLGARLLQDDAASKQQSGIAVELNQRGDSSALARVSMALSEAFTRVLNHLAFARGENVAEGKVYVEFSTDFGVRGLDAQLLAQMMLGVQQGHLSWHVFSYNVQRAGLYPEGWTQAQEEGAIDKGRPGGPDGEGAMGRPIPSGQGPDDDGERKEAEDSEASA